MNESIWIPTILLCIGTSLTTIGLFLPNYVDRAVEKTIAKETVMTNGSKVLEGWRQSKATVYASFYIFNLTNREEVEGFGAKPIFQEVGPYVYLKTRQQVIYRWLDNDTLMEYETIERYYFEPKLTKGSLDDQVTTLNIPIVTIAQVIQTLPSWLRGMATSAIKNGGENFTITTSVGQLLFDGYEIPVARKLMKFGSYFKSDIKDMERFCIMYQRNGSSDGVLTVRTGVDNIRTRFEIEKWNNRSSIDCWSESRGGACRVINGTDGTTIHPLFSRNEKLYIFSPGLNRSVYLDYAGDSEFKGIPTLVYKVPNSLFAGDTSPDNCFCVHNETELSEDGFCSLSGVMRLSGCQQGRPLVVSSPHLLNADPLLFQPLEGLSPNPEIHESVMEIEPLTGVPIRVNKRLQINVDLKKVKSFPGYPNMIFPILWIEEAAVISDDVIEQLNEQLFNKLAAARVITISSLIVGIISILLVPIIFLYKVVPKAGLDMNIITKRNKNGLNCHYNPVENNNTSIKT